MDKTKHTFSAARRRFLSLLGLGAAGAALSTVASDKVFAKQFCGTVSEGSLPPPQMVYDPKLQMMVNPLTHQPVFEDAKKLQLANPTITRVARIARSATIERNRSATLRRLMKPRADTAAASLLLASSLRGAP